MFKKFKIITLILIKILYETNLISENNKKKLKTIADKLKEAKNDNSLNEILKSIIIIENELKEEVAKKHSTNLDDKLIYEFIKKISPLINENRYLKKIKKLFDNTTYEHSEIIGVFNNYIVLLENYLKDINNQKMKYNEISEVLNSMFDMIAKLPKTNANFKDRLFELKEKIENTDDIKNIKKLKNNLMSMIDDIQVEITTFTNGINTILEENLKFANLKIKSLEHKVNEVLQDSYSDALTGALNKKWLKENFDDFFWFEKNKNHLLIFLDVDYFKLVNDTYGHGTGDIVLKEIVKRFKKALRGNKEDKIIRYGGDEFILILTNVREGYIPSILDRLLKSINSRQFDINNNPINLTISIGASLFNEAKTPEELSELTDKKLYLSKKNGRNCFTKDI